MCLLCGKKAGLSPCPHFFLLHGVVWLKVTTDNSINIPQFPPTVFNLYCIDEYSHKEIAEALGITEKGSASALAKAKKQLKEDIKQYLKER